MFSLLVAWHLAYLGLCGEWVGVLLWPAAAAHTILTLLLAREWFIQTWRSDNMKF